MRILYSALSVIGLLAIAVPASVYAQSAPPVIKVKSGKPYVHKHSGLSVPENLGGMKRSGTKAYFANELDVGIQYEVADASEAITIYIFRNTSGNIPLWFDRAREQIEKRPNFGKVTAISEPVAFVVAGQENASAMRVTYALSGASYKSSGLALIPVGEFYVKVRVSSSTRTAEDLDGLLSKVISDIKWPSTTTAHPTVAAIKPCENALSFEGTPNRVAQKGANTLFAGLMNSAATAANKDDKTQQTPALFCRDAYNIFPSGVYRRDNATDGYVLALADSGRAIDVGPDTIEALLKEEPKGDGKNNDDTKDTAKSYSINFQIPDQVMTYGARDRLPSPEQLIQIVQSEAPTVTASTWGKNRGNIQINSDTFKP
jgi:hypothetical protein